VCPAATSGLPTNATSGPSSSGSSRSAALQSSLASRLRELTDLSGSPEYALRWKDWGMTLGQPICALRASRHRISDSDFTGWPTAQARDHFFPHSPEYLAKQRALGYGMANLSDAVVLTGWPTPMANKLSPQTRDDFTPNLAAVTQLAGWPTPSVTESGESPGTVEARRQRHKEEKHKTPGLMKLGTAVQFCGWPTARANDGTGSQMPPGREGGHSLKTATQLVGWATPRSEPSGGGNASRAEKARLEDLVQIAGWPTPMAGNPGTENYNAAGSTDSSRRTVALVGWATLMTRDHKDGASTNSAPINGLLGRQVWLAGWNTPRATDGSKGGPNQAGGALPADAALTLGAATASFFVVTGNFAGCLLNPRFSLWLMGFPDEWACCGVRAMQSFHRSRRASSKRS